MLTTADLVNDMAKSCKPHDRWRIGIEHEQFVFNKATGKPLPYDGVPGIRQILAAFITEYGWAGVERSGHLIEAQRDGALVCVEPGGQMEFAGAPHLSLFDLKVQADRYYSELAALGDKLGFGVLARGFHPAWSRDQINWMPKERYHIQRPYMERHGAHGIDMMILTCGAQINLDFSSEADMVRKFRVALGLQPVITALMANSRIIRNQESGYECFRSFIWTETDPQRCGVPPFIFKDGMGFAAYAEYALDVPMYLIIRDGRYHDVAGQSFRDFMKGELKGHAGVFATLDDWHYHLTVLFPEVRLRSYLEFRGPDSAPREEIYAMAAFWAGLFYNQAALDQAWNLIYDWPAEEHVRIRNEVPKLGLKTPVPEHATLRELGQLAFDLAVLGLQEFEPSAVEDLRPLYRKLAA